MAHLRKQIRDRVVTNLTGLTTTGSRVFASRVYPMAAGNLPGLCIYTKNEEIEALTMVPPRTTLRAVTLTIEGYASATSNLDATLDAISLEVEEALAGDIRQNNLARDTRTTGIEFEYADDGEQPIGMVRLDVTVEYVTAENDLENAA
jgi:hypothetical protein